MQIIRREFLALSGLAVAAPSIATIALAQAQAGPKLTQILRKDLEGQGDVVQETVVTWKSKAREARCSRPEKQESFPPNSSTSPATRARTPTARRSSSTAALQRTNR